MLNFVDTVVIKSACDIRKKAHSIEVLFIMQCHLVKCEKENM